MSDDRWPEPDIERLVARGLSQAEAWEIMKRQAEADEQRQLDNHEPFEMSARDWSDLQVRKARLRLASEYPAYFPDVKVI